MKRLLLSALLVLLAAALHAQEFYRITDIDDDERALEVSAVSYLDASENRFGAQVAYEIKPLTAYFEVSFFSEHLGEEYGGIKYKAPSFRVGMDYGFFEYGMLTLFTGAYIGITPYSTEYLERDKNAYVSSKRLVKVTENGFIAGLKLGTRLDFLDRVCRFCQHHQLGPFHRQPRGQGRPPCRGRRSQCGARPAVLKICASFPYGIEALFFSLSCSAFFSLSYSGLTRISLLDSRAKHGNDE